MSLDEAPRGFVTMRDHLKALEEIDRLKEQVDYLRSEAIAPLEDWELLRHTLGLCPQEAKVLSILWNRRGLVRWAEFAPALGGDVTPNHVAVVFSHIKAKGRARGWPDFCASMPGYYGGRKLSEEARAWLLERVPELATGAKK